MPFASHRVAPRNALGPLAGGTAAMALAAALVLTGCGGASDAFIVADARADAGLKLASASPVQLEGCIDDAQGRPKTGSTLRALTADGRLVGSAVSDSDGIFRIQLQPGQTVRIEIGRAGDEAMVVSIGSGNLSIGGCLRDSEA